MPFLSSLSFNLLEGRGSVRGILVPMAAVFLVPLELDCFKLVCQPGCT